MPNKKFMINYRNGGQESGVTDVSIAHRFFFSHKMRYSILGFSQSAVLSLSKTVGIGGEGLDITDLLILWHIADFQNRSNIIKYIIDGRTYFSVRYSAIVDDLPILGIKQQALRDRLNKLCTFGLLEKAVVRNQQGCHTAFRIGENYGKIVYSDDEIRTDTEIPVRTDTKIPPTDTKIPVPKNNKPTTDSCAIEELVERKRVHLDFSIVSPDMLDVVKDWLQYKKEKGQSYKPSGFKSFYARLCKLSGNDPKIAQEIIEASKSNNYAGIFPLKKQSPRSELDYLPTGMILRGSQEEREEKIKSSKWW